MKKSIIYLIIDYINNKYPYMCIKYKSSIVYKYIILFKSKSLQICLSHIMNKRTLNT